MGSACHRDRTNSYQLGENQLVKYLDLPSLSDWNFLRATLLFPYDQELVPQDSWSHLVRDTPREPNTESY